MCRYSHAIFLVKVNSRVDHSEQDVAKLNGLNVAASELIRLLDKKLILSNQPCEPEKEFDRVLGERDRIG